jgi:hypothetical protein
LPPIDLIISLYKSDPNPKSKKEPLQFSQFLPQITLFPLYFTNTYLNSEFRSFKRINFEFERKFPNWGLIWVKIGLLDSGLDQGAIGGANRVKGASG